MWAGIAGELGLSGESGSQGTGDELAPRRAAAVRRRFALPVAAALVGAAIGGSLVFATGSRTVNGPTPAAVPRVLAATALRPVAGGPGTPAESGEATMPATADGRRLRITVAALTQVAPTYEVWLLVTGGKMVSLGLLDSGEGLFPVPADLDMAQFPTVDNSDEPLDGNPQHSTVSVLRGKLL